MGGTVTVHSGRYIKYISVVYKKHKITFPRGLAFYTKYKYICSEIIATRFLKISKPWNSQSFISFTSAVILLQNLMTFAGRFPSSTRTIPYDNRPVTWGLYAQIWDVSCWGSFWDQNLRSVVICYLNIRTGNRIVTVKYCRNFGNFMKNLSVYIYLRFHKLDINVIFISEHHETRWLFEFWTRYDFPSCTRPLSSDLPQLHTINKHHVTRHV